MLMFRGVSKKNALNKNESQPFKYSMYIYISNIYNPWNSSPNKMPGLFG